MEMFASLQGWDGGLKLSGLQRSSWVGTQRRQYVYFRFIFCAMVLERWKVVITVRVVFQHPTTCPSLQATHQHFNTFQNLC